MKTADFWTQTVQRYGKDKKPPKTDTYNQLSLSYIFKKDKRKRLAGNVKNPQALNYFCLFVFRLNATALTVCYGPVTTGVSLFSGLGASVGVVSVGVASVGVASVGVTSVGVGVTGSSGFSGAGV